jgi:hypothetical protein
MNYLDIVYVHRQRIVSMEPRFFNHGDQDHCAPSWSLRWSFQWSHGFSTMETRLVRTRCGSQLARGFNGATVLQPWRRQIGLRSNWKASAMFQWSHGSSTMETRMAQPSSSWFQSMAFQWSHGSSTMETGMTDREIREFADDPMFQWSHGSSTMETPHVFRRGSAGH